jgi:hypothetical protein
MDEATDVVRDETLAALQEALGRAVSEDERAVAISVVDEIVRFDEQPPSGAAAERIYISKGATWLPTGGKSVKAGNLWVNLGQVFEAVVSGTGAAFAFANNPIVGTLSALVACKKLVGAATVNLSEDDAFVMWATWTCENLGQPVDAEHIRDVANAEAKKAGSPKVFTAQEVTQSLDNLERIKAVTMTDGEWETTESIVVKT